jgi:nicotinate-nucleotide adenylyltransferase
VRVAIYGGSFNPPHVGHALVAAWLRWADRADAVWLLPTWSHAFGKALAPFPARVAWCESLAGAVGPWVSVSTIEAELPAPSYTIDTLRAFAARHPEHRFRLVIGADNLDVLDKWRDWDAIAAGFDPIVVGRAGWPAPEGAVVFPEVSSTEIRARLAAGQPVDHLVPAAVLALLGDAWSDQSGGENGTIP